MMTEAIARISPDVVACSRCNEVLGMCADDSVPLRSLGMKSKIVCNQGLHYCSEKCQEKANKGNTILATIGLAIMIIFFVTVTTLLWGKW